MYRNLMYCNFQEDDATLSDDEAEDELVSEEELFGRDW